jgi:hypothetical protein
VNTVFDPMILMLYLLRAVSSRNPGDIPMFIEACLDKL